MMRLAAAPVTLLLLAACSPAPNPQHRQIMRQIEQRVKLPDGSEKLEAYARYYAMDGNRVVGTFILLVDPKNKHYSLAAGQQRWIDDRRNLPAISDGGCAVVNVLYDPVTRRIEAFCNGLA